MEKIFNMGRDESIKKILLYSGGMDSWLIRHIWKPDECIYINMHTKYSETELKKLDNNIKIIDFPLGQYERGDAIIPLRNLYLAMCTCNEFPDGDLEICIGATAGDRVLDKSQKFIKMASEMLTYLYQPQHWIPGGRKVQLSIPFKSYTKTELIKTYLEQGGDINEAFNQSFSCYNPHNGEPCWRCKPCFRKFVSFYLNGYKFSGKIKTTAIDYIFTEIYPQIVNGTYGRADEEEEILKVLEKEIGSTLPDDY